MATVLIVERTDSYYSRTLKLESIHTPQFLPPVLGTIHLSADDSPASSGGGGAELAEKETVAPALPSVSFSSRDRYIAAPDISRSYDSYDSDIRSELYAEA